MKETSGQLVQKILEAHSLTTELLLVQGHTEAFLQLLALLDLAKFSIAKSLRHFSPVDFVQLEECRFMRPDSA